MQGLTVRLTIIDPPAAYAGDPYFVTPAEAELRAMKAKIRGTGLNRWTMETFALAVQKVEI